MSDQPLECPGQLDLLTDAPTQRPVRDTELAPWERSSATSREAALSIYGSLVTRRAKVLAFIAEHQPCTDAAIAEGLRWDGNSVRPRRRELDLAGVIVKAGEVTLPTGRKAVTWKVAE